MDRQAIKSPLIVASIVALASDFLPVPGLLAAALVFPQGIHSDHGFAYLALALVINFAIFFIPTFVLFRFIRQWLESRKAGLSD
jgi:hypothetical protein